jgi:hypothetical protein
VIVWKVLWDNGIEVFSIIQFSFNYKKFVPNMNFFNSFPIWILFIFFCMVSGKPFINILFDILYPQIVIKYNEVGAFIYQYSYKIGFYLNINILM